MTALQTPAPDAPAEEWGALAVSLPGWRWMPGMIDTYPSFRLVVDYDPELDDLSDSVPDPDDSATAGCLLALLSFAGISMHLDSEDCVRVEWWSPYDLEGDPHVFEAPTIGRVCIMVAAHNGKWTGGDS